ncbi:hypothetical protein HYW68_02705 [Candidatus Parcubacteria bacterium]|nr:hypothetical protein [Candidatus Parcubacteria bacterium]
MRFNRERSKAIQQENEQFRAVGRRGIGTLSKRELLVAGAALYWGEGTKSEKRPSPMLALSNSDPRLVALFMRFVREILGVPEDRIRSGVHIYPNLTAEKARRFWAKVTGLPADKFYVVNQVSRASQSRRPRNSLPYGTVSVRVSSRALFQRVLGCIEGFADNATK